MPAIVYFSFAGFLFNNIKFIRMKVNTKAINSKHDNREGYGALSFPVYNAVAYEFDNAEMMSDVFCSRVKLPDYSRVENPTVSYFENRVKDLTGAKKVTALNSGMAAICNTLFALSSQGKNIISTKHLFGNTYLLLTKTLKKFGVLTKMCDLTDIDEVEGNIDGNTCCVYVEIMSNPQLEIAPLKKLSDILKKKRIPLVVDTTLIPFTRFDARELGIDIEIVSSTKYISGGGTCLGGLIIDYGNYNEFTECIEKEMLLNFGAYMTPQVAYMQTLGLETLECRYSVQSSNALYLAEKMNALPAVKFVNYVGLKDNPYYDIACQQFGETFGAMITIELESKEKCYGFIDRLQLIHRATNLFDNRTLAIHPASTIYGTFSSQEREYMDVSETMIRLSIGLEDKEDLLNDIKQALQ